MRAAALALALLCTLPVALASVAPTTASSDGEYAYVVDSSGRRTNLADTVILNGKSVFPWPHETSLTVTAVDSSGLSVLVQVCHEWTYNDGKHPTVTCVKQCSLPSLTTALVHPPDDGNTVYRIIVSLFDKPHGCQARATTGHLTLDFS